MPSSCRRCGSDHPGSIPRCIRGSPSSVVSQVWPHTFSLNLFFPAGAEKKSLHQVHFNAWKKGCKGLYYLRTETGQRAENVSMKVERDALKDYETQALSQEECVACQG